MKLLPTSRTRASVATVRGASLPPLAAPRHRDDLFGETYPQRRGPVRRPSEPLAPGDHAEGPHDDGIARGDKPRILVVETAVPGGRLVVVHGSFVTRDGVRSPSVRRSGVAGTDAHRPGDGSSRGT